MPIEPFNEAYDPAEYPPENPVRDVNRDDWWNDPNGTYRGEFDPTDVIVNQPDPTPWWEN